MENPIVVAVATTVIIVASAFFVAVEFALIAARKHRLEDAAPGSRSARAALRSSTELSVLLAGSQLGITVCVLALGAITKPAVHHWLTPAFADWGAPHWAADVAGFVLALVVVTFLHLVVGEMAPKSWAIAHPERSATLLAIPMRAFMWLTRPLLSALNNAANACLVRVGVTPVDEVASGQDRDALRQLIEHSASVGALESVSSAQLAGALELDTLTVGDLVRDAPPTQVPEGARVADVQAASLRSGHLRILVGSGHDWAGVVHVRDTLELDPRAGLDDVVRPPLRLASDTLVYEALARMRETSNQLAVVTDPDVPGRMVGLVTVADLLQRLVAPVR